MRLLFLAVLSPLFLGGCQLNAFYGPGTYDRYYAVGDVMQSIDDTAHREAAGRTPIPNRDRTIPSWRHYWESWFDVWRQSTGSVGTHSAELIEHARRIRKELGLPDLEKMHYSPREKPRRSNQTLQRTAPLSRGRGIDF
jgi:hypothetical protein